MRVFTAALATETNTFSPIFIDRRGFEGSLYAPPGQHPETPTLCTAPITVGRRVCREKGWTLVEGTAAWADPAGLVNRDDLRSRSATRSSASLARRCPSMRWCWGCTARWSPRATTTRRATFSRASGDDRAGRAALRRARPAQPPDGEAGGGGGLLHRVQGISPHRLRGPGGGPVADRGRHARGAGAAGDVGVRLPDDRRLPDLARADAGLRRPDAGDRAGRSAGAVAFGDPRLHGGRRAGDGDEDDRGHRRRAPSMARRWRGGWGWSSSPTAGGT